MYNQCYSGMHKQSIYRYAAYSIKNGGVFKGSSENAETVVKEEVDYLVNKARDNSRILYTKVFRLYQ